MKTLTIPLAEALGIIRDEGEDALSSLLACAVKTSIDGFECAKSDFHVNFLKDKALKYHTDEVSKTYLVMNADVFSDVLNDNTDADLDRLIVAYFNVGVSSLVLTSHGFTKKRQGRIRGRMFTRDDSVGCYVIGSLCRSDRYSKDDLSGFDILKMCLAVIKDAQKMVGGSFVLVESRRAVFESMYAKAGFEELYVSANKTGDGAEMIVSGVSIAK